MMPESFASMNAAPASVGDPARVLAVLRRVILVVLLLGFAGMGAELLLLNHTEGFWQLVPLALIASGLGVLGWYSVGRQRSALRAFQAAMLLFCASGIAGVVLHFQGKIEFKREIDPALAGWALFREALKGAAPPVLAPAAMIQFGLLGLAFTYRHPALAPAVPIHNSQPQSTI